MAFTGTDRLDAFIGALIVLLILSLITEKLVEFIRNHISVPKSVNPFGWFKNISTKPGNEILTHEKKREITLLSIITGIIVAFAAKASLFDLLSPKLQDELFWPEGLLHFSEDTDIVKCIAGMLFTGFFLSFGSRFFHDLLDTLCQIKELKRQLLKKEVTYKEEVNERIAQKVLDMHGPELKRKYPDIELEVGSTVNNTIGIIATFPDSVPSGFPTQLAIDPALGNGIVQVEALTSENADAHYGLECRVRNPEYFDSQGSFGGVVISKEKKGKFLLTCSHVALGGRSKNLGGYIQDTIDVQILDRKANERYKGDLIYAKRTNEIDAALVSLPEIGNKIWDNTLPDKTQLKKPVSVDNISLAEKIFFYSSRAGEKIEGTLSRRCSNVPVTLRYDDLTTDTYRGLIVAGNDRGGFWSAISEKGDSGSLLFDKNGSPFAMIIGGGTQFTYALPLLDVLEKTRSEIFT